TDILLVVFHFNNKHIWWASLTLAFIVPPMAVASIWCIGLVIKHSKWSCLKKSSLVTMCIVGLPITPFVLFARGIAASCKGLPSDNDAFIAPEVMRLWEVFAETYPQIFLQLYILMTYILNGIDPSNSQ
ncbi:unnamed protein product, partial [Meganyctiphanes norvegica]